VLSSDKNAAIQEGKMGVLVQKEESQRAGEIARLSNFCTAPIREKSQPARRWVIFLFVLGSISVSCFIAQALASQAAAPAQTDTATQAPPDYQVIILDPLLRFEDIRNESVPPAYAGANDSFESRLLYAARNEVESRKLSVVKPETLSQLAAADLCKQLQTMSSRLARGNINDEAREILNRLAAINDRHVVLAQFMKVKLGPGRSWNSYSGAITSAMNSTLLQAALVSCKTGQVLWKNEVLVRKAMRSDSPEFVKALGLLYQTLESR
jgi:hypothetical protein